MKGYLIVEMSVEDPELFERYRTEAKSVLADAPGAGKVIVRAANNSDTPPLTLEGGWAPQRIAIIEFDSLDDAKRFYYSSEYQNIFTLRMDAARSRAILVEGLN